MCACLVLFLLCSNIEIEESVSLHIIPHFCKYKLVVSMEFKGASLLRIYRILQNETKNVKIVQRENGFGLHTSGAVKFHFHSLAPYIFALSHLTFLLLAYSQCATTALAVQQLPFIGCVAICLHSATVNLVLLKKQRLNFIFILR